MVPVLESIRAVVAAAFDWWRLIVLVLLVLCCAWATYTDLTRRIVTNRNVLAILLLGVVAQLLHVLQGASTWWYVPALTLLSLATGFGLYYLGYWSAGDGKFYAAVCIAFPLAPPSFALIPVQILSISLVGAFAFLLIRGARPLAVTLYHMLRDRVQSGRTRPAWGTWLSALGLQILQMAAFLGLSYLVSAVMPLQLGIMQALVLALGLTWFLDLLSLWQKVVILATLIGAAVFFFLRLPADREITLVLTYLCANLGRGMVQVVEKAMPRSVPCSDLKPGYFVSQCVVIGPDGHQHHLPPAAWAQQEQADYTFVVGPSDGALTPGDVARIHTLIADGVLVPEAPVALSWSVPFAPVISVAVLAMVTLSYLT